MSRQVYGFTLIELMILIVIIGILASLAISAYQTYTVRAQVSEGIRLAGAIKLLIVDAYNKNGMPPASLVEAGMSAAAADTEGSYVTQVNVVNGRIDVTFGHAAHPDIQGGTVSLTPYMSDGRNIVWRCGAASSPPGRPVTGAGVTAVHRAPTIDPRYLPSACR